MASRRFRVPMFFKFLAGCLLLAFLLILGGSVVVHLQTKMESRGNYLVKHFKRYLEYQQGLGRALSSVTDLVAHEEPLRQAMAAAQGDNAAVPAGAPSAAAIAEKIFEVLQGKNAVRPDLMLLFDRRGKLIWSRLSDHPEGGFDPQHLGEMAAVHVVAQGHSYFDKVLIHDGRAYQISGVPVRQPGGEDVIGGLLMGVNLRRYMEDYKAQSDARENMQHRLTLIYKPDLNHDSGQVVASVMPEDTWRELEDKLPIRDPGHWTYADDLGEYRQRMAQLSPGDYDVYGPRHPQDKDSVMALVEGFAGLNQGTIGELYLLRSRANLEGRGPTVPWFEIGIGVALSVLIAFILAMFITRPIKSFVDQSRRILEGETDLTQRIRIHSRDETQDLAENINQVFERLYALASEVQGAAFHVGASSAEISAASKQMLGGLKDQTMKIEGSTAAVTELSTSIQQVAANAAEATRAAERSNVAVTSAVERMQEIRASVEDAAAKMQELGESSKRIGNIVEVIRQISEQTSLLALNASIEAAHAGEQGRGFAVVADEVSSLARRVGQSAKDIESLIQTIKEQTAEAVSSMQIGTREVEQGTQLVTDTLSNLTALIHVVKDTATAVQEQAVVSDEIARNMDAVQSIATEVLSGSEESVIQAEQLHELAFALERSVGGFNLDDGSTAGDAGSTAGEAGRKPAGPTRVLRSGARKQLPER
jgi:methyl-accepting chemotaxis protein